MFTTNAANRCCHHFMFTLPSQQLHLLALLETAILITEYTHVLNHYRYASITVRNARTFRFLIH